MTITTEEFISMFHSLNGITEREKRKHLVDLFKYISKNELQDLDFSTLHPKNFIEEKLKIDALLHFRRVSELLQILKGGNQKHITKVLKASNWLLQELFQDISGKDLIENIFPYLSFNTKVKILNKLCVHWEDIQKGDEFFEAILASYGLYLASKIIPCCSGELIIKYLRAYQIELTPAQLIIIIKKYPKLTEDIFEILNNYRARIKIEEKYSYVFKYLMHHDRCMFLKLNKKYKPKFHVGRRATKQFIKHEQQVVIENSKTFHELLNKKQIVKSLKQNFKNYYVNLLPSSLRECQNEYENLLSFLSFLPSDMQRANLLLTSFKEMYGEEVWEHPKFVTSKLLELMSSSEREIWMETHARPSEMSEESWISFMKTEKSIPLLKKRISFSSNIKSRADIVTFLVSTCKFNNNDYAALLDVCKYVVEHHHNDHYSVRQNCLRTITECFDMQKLEEQHWVYINELMHFGLVNDEHFYGNYDILRANIEYRLSKNLAIDEQLTLWIRLEDCELELKNTKYQKQCLEKHCELILSANKGDVRQDESGFMECLRWIGKWNKKHHQDQISWLPYRPLLNRIKLSLEQNKHDWRTEDVLQQYLLSDIDKKEKEDMLNAYMACKNTDITPSITIQMITCDTSFTVRHIDVITKRLLQTWYNNGMDSVWQYMKNYDIVGIPQGVCSVCKDLYNKNNDAGYDDVDVSNRWNPDKIKTGMTALSYLMDAEDFLKFIDVYYPTSPAVDVKSKKGRFICKVQRAIAVSIKNVVPAERALVGALRFSTGDYLSFVQKSLHFISYNVPENELVPLLNKLSTQSVSVRKHAICLLFKLANKTQLQDMLIKFMETDKNSSIRKYLFKGSFNIFKNEASPASWELVKQNVLTLNKHDNEAFTLLTKWKKIPSSYLVQYIPFTWDILEQLPNSNAVVEGRCAILDAISADIIEELPNELFTKIIQKYFFKSKQLTSFESRVQSLACKSIIYSKTKSIQEERLNIILTILKDYISKTWYNAKTCVTGRTSVFKFIQEYCLDFLEGKCHDKAILTKLFHLWNDFMKPEKAFNIYLYLQLTEKYLDCKTLDEIGKELIALYSSALSNNGPVINDCFGKTLKLILNHFLLSSIAEVAEENRYTLIQNIITSDAAGDFLMLVIFLLPDEVPTVSKCSIVFNDIIMSLLKSANPYIDIYLHEYLTSTYELS